jgi:PAT family beta-lactamase induction signal transducer AmpG
LGTFARSVYTAIFGTAAGLVNCDTSGVIDCDRLYGFATTQASITTFSHQCRSDCLFSATQDIVADAYRTDVLHELEMGAGAAVFVLGYRMAMLLTGSLALILADRIPWSSVYLLMAASMAIGIFGTLLAPEPKRISPPETLADAVILAFGEFFQRKGVLQAFLVLLFILFYKLGDAFLSSMATPFLLQTGFTLSDIGIIQTGMGIIASIVGALVGGAILSKIGINRSLWVFGILQALSNLAYFFLAQLGKNYQFW